MPGERRSLKQDQGPYEVLHGLFGSLISSRPSYQLDRFRARSAQGSSEELK